MNSLYSTPVTGMHGAEFALDVTANNIANVNTSGYQEVESVVSNLPTQAEIGDPNNGASVSPLTHVGMGVRPAETARNENGAQLQATGNPLDIAVSGPAYLALRQPDGQLVYARQARFRVEPNGRLTTPQGAEPTPPVRVPVGVTLVTADREGRLTGQTPAGARVPVGRLAVVTFPAPENLREQGGLYYASVGSGRPVAGTAGPVGKDIQVMGGYELRSTVDLATEMANMIEAQRMYEANSKALQTLDSLVNGIVNLQPR